MPFSFEVQEIFTNTGSENKSLLEERNSNETIETKDLDLILESVHNQLKGHNEFKTDLTFQLKKLFLLNGLGFRSVFSIFLAGESGIGKTQFSKILSTTMYPSEEIIKINFGNYSNEGALNSLIGSPKGYIGSDSGGELILKITNSKTKIILFDEFEKATLSVFHFFYELLEDGQFTDRQGVSHNLDGYIVVFTSNLTDEGYSQLIPDPLKSRFDMVYCFDPLTNIEKAEYVMDEVNKLISCLNEKNHVRVDVTDVSVYIESLISSNNLREIKRKTEDYVINKYFLSENPFSL